VWRGHTRDHGREQVRFYGCGNHSKRGARVCSNGLVARTAATDAHVLATPAEDVLRPTVINQAIALALDERAPSRSTSRSVVRLRVSSLCQSASFVCSHGSSTVRSITVAAATFIVHRRELIGPASTQSACAGIRADEADAHRHRTAFGRLDERTLLRVDSDALQRAELVGCAAPAPRLVPIRRGGHSSRTDEGHWRMREARRGDWTRRTAHSPARPAKARMPTRNRAQNRRHALASEAWWGHL
jgi:hypothetical protein